MEQDLGKGRKGQTVKIIDFDNPDNNEFLCVNQFKVEGPNQNIIPDIVLFVNGLPLAVIECKSPYITNPMEAGINQLLRYANRRQPHEDEGAERLFWYNQMMVSTHRDKARVGTISSRMEHYLEWKDPYPLTVEQLAAQLQPDAANQPVYGEDLKVAEQPGDYGLTNSQQVLIAGLFNRKNFLDLIQNFTVFEPVDGRTIKKLARYQQFRAVHKTIERIKTGKTRKDRGGVIWHTQGSGKSLTMVFLAVKMRRDEDLKEYKLVFITDRTQLDQQLTATFERAQGETVYHAKSVAHLKELLQKDSSDLVTAMMQKFQEDEDDFDFPVLNESEKIIVLADEAHRTQYGTLGVAINAGYPMPPRLPSPAPRSLSPARPTTSSAPTSTPTPLNRLLPMVPRCKSCTKAGKHRPRSPGIPWTSFSMNISTIGPMKKRRQSRQKYGTELAVLEAPQRIRWVCIDILKHYREHIQPNGFKAMMVTSSRRAAVLYKETLDELGAPPSEVHHLRQPQ